MPRRFNVSAAVCVERCAVSAMTPRTASARAVLAPCALRRCAENFLIRLRRLGIVGLIRLRQRLAPYASNRSSDLVGRRFCLCRLVLDYLHRMTLRRIHAKQCRAALGDLEQKQPTPDVAILEGLGAKCLLQRVELNQLQGQCAALCEPAGLQGRTRDTELEGGPPGPRAKSSRLRFEPPARRDS